MPIGDMHMGQCSALGGGPDVTALVEWGWPGWHSALRVKRGEKENNQCIGFCPFLMDIISFFNIIQYF
eukprot:UN15188